MNSQSNCRRSVSSAAAAPRAVSQAEGLAGQVAQAGKTLDIHVHLFGAGDAGSGCRLSKTTSGGQSSKHLADQLRLGERAKTIDEACALALVEQVEESTLDKAVILAQDAVYDRCGKPDWEKTHFYVPNDYCVMVHTGHEHTAPIFDISLADSRKLELALDSGCTVVACHCATGWQTDSPDMLPGFLAMVRKYKKLWGDTAVLGSAGRTRDFERLLADEEARTRLLHGSDFPFPAAPLAFGSIVGPENASHLQAIENRMDQDLALKETLGIGRASVERAYRLVCGELPR